MNVAQSAFFRYDENIKQTICCEMVRKRITNKAVIMVKIKRSGSYNERDNLKEIC